MPGARPQASEPRVKIAKPAMYISTFPVYSDSLPKMSRVLVIVSR
jgi:hypothetical protein